MYRMNSVVLSVIGAQKCLQATHGTPLNWHWLILWLTELRHHIDEVTRLKKEENSYMLRTHALNSQIFQHLMEPEGDRSTYNQD